jgi:Asp-tRNA(Asn)/Glu-tRNA(Gln) amidotransferase C subunit
MEISEEKRESIRKEAKQILDNFGKTLEKVKFKEKKKEKGVGGFREEGKGQEGEKDFRERMFKNAPNKGEDSIIAEKKKW